MTNRQSIISLLQSAKSALEQKYGIKALALFGSYGRNEATADSDVDVLVDFSKPIGLEFVDLADELEQILQMRVDLVSRNGIKPKYFQSIESELIYV